MKIVGFHLMPYRHLPSDFEHRHRSVWVDIPPGLFDPERGADAQARRDYEEHVMYFVEKCMHVLDAYFMTLLWPLPSDPALLKRLHRLTMPRLWSGGRASGSSRPPMLGHGSGHSSEREAPMTLTKTTMTNEQRKSVALEYLKAFDNGGVTSSGGSILDLFASDAQVYFPKWGVATGKDEIGRLFGDVGATIKSIVHHYSHFNWIFSGSDLVVCEGTSHGQHVDGPWRAGAPEWGAGRWCDVFEIRDWLIQRCFIYLDPDYAGKDVARYPWLRVRT